MAHHSPELPDAFRQEAERLRLGATGAYPKGKLNECDDGEIQLAITADTKNRVIVMNFGTPTAWVGFYPEQCEQIIESLQEKMLELRGITP